MPIQYHIFEELCCCYRIFAFIFRVAVMQSRIRIWIFVVIGLFVAFVLVDSIGVFDSKSWYEVPHGSHAHYLPKDCDPPLPVGNGPTTPPGPGQTVDCQGRIVPEP